VAIYKDKNDKSIFSSIDFDDANNTAFFFVKHEVDVEKAKELLAGAGETTIAQSYIKGHTVIVTHGKTQKDELFAKLGAADSCTFQPEPPEQQTPLKFIKKNGWKIRGGSSIVGQTMTLFAAMRGISKENAAAGKLNYKFEPAMGFYAIFSLMANFTNYFLGGQKEEDIKGLEKFDGIIADEINHYLPDNQPKVSPDEVRKLSYMSDKELAEHNKNRDSGPVGVFKRNSAMLGEVGLRSIGSLSMVIDYTKLREGWRALISGGIKQAWETSKTQNAYTRTAGYAMVAGKIMGLLTQTQDPNNPPTTYWGEIRQKVLWPVSSAFEAVAQTAMAWYSHTNKKVVWGGKAHYDMPGVLGNAILTVPPYGSRFVIPYGKKIFPIDEVQARLLDELHKLPQDKIPEVAARVTARMVEHMGEASPEFSELYRKLLEKLENYHDISVIPYKAEPRMAVGGGTPVVEKQAEIVEKEQPEPAVKFADKVSRVEKVPHVEIGAEHFANREMAGAALGA